MRLQIGLLVEQEYRSSFGSRVLSKALTVVQGRVHLLWSQAVWKVLHRRLIS